MSDGAELKAWRIRLGFKQRELAAILGMSTRGYQDIEQGKASVRPVYLLAMKSLENDLIKPAIQSRIDALESALHAALRKMEFAWDQFDADGGLSRKAEDTPDSQLWEEIVTARNALGGRMDE